ncbi:hypothetical protein F4777DRAFT_129155 [Nemania sp. FL0916]|nr:hypothetical protein F4777DRAFT_129155 [Nemania sp. FL0916]
MTSTSAQTDSGNNADIAIPGHELPDASLTAPSIIVSHGRLAVSPLIQEDFDQDVGVYVCVCIACREPFRNDTALRSHGQDEGHRPYGCICGSVFTCLYTLNRHIADKNNAAKFPCPLCEQDEAPRAFPRVEHLYQHFRHFHKIAAGRVPDEFAVDPSRTDNAEGQIHLPPQVQHMSFFPCLVTGCTKIYIREEDLDDHVLCMHYPPQGNMLTLRAPSGSTFNLMNNSSQQNPYFGQGPQQTSFLQHDPIGNFHANEDFLEIPTSAGGSSSQPHDELNTGYEGDWYPDDWIPYNWHPYN